VQNRVGIEVDGSYYHAKIFRNGTDERDLDQLKARPIEDPNAITSVSKSDSSPSARPKPPGMNRRTRPGRLLKRVQIRAKSSGSISQKKTAFVGKRNGISSLRP
jgi:hypothetical protein